MSRISTTHTPLTAASQYIDELSGLAGDTIFGAVFSDQTGTLFIEQTLDDGATWAVSESIAVTGGTVQTFAKLLYLPRARCRFVNGGTNQNKFDLVARVTSSTYSS